jgi:hypothetical protein
MRVACDTGFGLGKGNKKLDVDGIVLICVLKNRIHLAMNADQWLAFVNKVIKARLEWKTLK